MSTQLDFWDEEPHGLARHSDPPTSHWAAEQLDANSVAGIVLAAIRKAGARGLIAGEFEAATGLALNTATPRTRPLCAKGLIFDSGEKRPGPSGKLQIVWKAY